MVLLIPVELKRERYKEFGRLAKAAETDERAEYIIENIDQYPKYITELFYDDPDNLEFVYNYPFCKANYATMSYTDEELSGVPALYMADPRWGYERIGKFTSIIKTDGCAYVCLTMAYIGLTGKSDVDPVILSGLAYDNGLTGSISAGMKLNKLGDLCSFIGLNGTYFNHNPDEGGKEMENIDELSQHIDNGAVVIAGMYGDTFGSHAIVIRGCEGNNVYINDPASPEKTAQTWNFDDIKSEFKGIWVITE